MKRDALADRIVNYSDALVAFSLVNGLAFLVALGEPDIRCSIAEIAVLLGLLNLGFPIASTSVLIWLERYEGKLRAGEDREDELVSHFLAIVRRARYVLVWSVGLIIVIGILAATQDPICLTLAN